MSDAINKAILEFMQQLKTGGNHAKSKRKKI